MLRWTVHLNEAPGFHKPTVSVGHEVYCFEVSYNSHSHRMCVHIFNTVSLRWRKLLLERKKATGRKKKGKKRECSFEEFRPFWLCFTAVLIEEKVYIWGGSERGERGYLYTFDVDTHMWLSPQVSGSVPKLRLRHSACASGKVMYICGGHRLRMNDTNDFYKLDTAAMVWSVIIGARDATPTPETLWDCATIVGTKIFVFEGHEDSCENKLKRVFDTETERWLQNVGDSGAPLAGGYCQAAFSHNGELYMFYRKSLPEEHNQCEQGIVGYNLSDLLRLDPQTFSWKKLEPRGDQGPGVLLWPCCCPLGDRVIVRAGNPPFDMYILDFRPSLKTLCKLAVIGYGVERSELPHNIRWELAAMTGTQ